MPHFILCLAVAVASRAAPPTTPRTAAGANATAAPATTNQGPPRLGGPTPEGIEFFETHIRPVLAAKCYGCHSGAAKKLRANLRLDTAERMRAGGDSGAAIVPHKPEESLLISALRYQSNEMPPSGKLPDAVINDFVKWIAMGAPDPRDEPTPESEKNKKNTKADPRDHWAYKQPQRSTPPKVTNGTAARCDIDRFVIARLESANLAPSPEASPRVLYRRLYYDLTGLPPTADELDTFAADPTDARYVAAVDRLLASPRFGERWARYWLDLARYADTKGYVFLEDRAYKQAFTYRDWVIASFNSDRPYDKFLIAQIAEDQIDDKTCAPATGFLTLGRRFLNVQPDIINDRIDVLSRGLLGLTVACARCHDHKFDPITAADYYALYGVFASATEKDRPDAPPQLVDNATPYDPVVFLRGNAGSPGPKVDRRFLAILSPDAKPAAFKHGSGRRELAEAIASKNNPLTARVWLNRIWEHLFGRGIVDTPSDFGSRGSPPTHPELLDSLACDLMDHGWSTKQIIREIVLSGTYRQSSDTRADCAAVDPDNKLLWRANRRRLDLEALRDSLLAAAGRLDLKIGGPSVSLTDPPFSTRRSVYGFIERQNLPAFFRTFDFANPSTHAPERPQTTAPQQALFLMNSPFAVEQATFLASHSELPKPAVAGSANVAAGSPDPATRPTAGLQPVRGQEIRAQQGQDFHTQQMVRNSAADRVRRINRLFRTALGRGPSVDELTDALEFVDGGDPRVLESITNQLTWQFGWGSVDEPARSVQFTPLARFANNTWQGGPVVPDPTVGWVLLTAFGGHPGDAGHAAVRRWTAPATGKLHIEGILGHSQTGSDGVRGRIVVARTGVVGAWDVVRSQAPTNPAVCDVQKGDTVDFVTDSRANVTSDDFTWPVTLRLTTSENDPGQVWDSTSGFHGPLTVPLTRWQELAQILMMSNEFAFVD